MEIVLGVIGAVALVWLFSDRGNFKRNMRCTAVTALYVGLAVAAMGVTANQTDGDVPKVTAVGVVFLLFLPLVVGVSKRLFTPKVGQVAQRQRAISRKPIL